MQGVLKDASFLTLQRLNKGYYTTIEVLALLEVLAIAQGPL